ncbi:MAG: sigma-70 family RNA polymerase sigma factor [Candidatus Eisenbacteria bacterium]|nr:sigma-70 family RNA polymerase sigma factor [Candidatus Eisenbacteria bacterium]
MDRNQLVAGLGRKDDDAWTVFFAEFGGLIRAVAARAGLSSADQAEVFQRTCVRVLERIETLREPRSLGAWVFGIASRLSLDLLRERSRSAPLEEAAGKFEAEIETGAEAPPSVLERLVELETVARVRDGLAELDPRCRRLLDALYLEDPRPSYREIAERESIPIGAIGPNRARCAERLAAILKRSVSNPPPARSGDTRGSALPGKVERSKG